MGMAVLLCVSCYLRPGELMGLTRASLVRPASCISKHWCLLLFPSEGVERSKTGTTDDSIAVDSEYLSWAGPIWEALTEGDPKSFLWTFTYPQFLKQIRLAISAWNLGEVVPYQMRHSGPSIDRAANRRTLLDCQKRGRWKSWQSVTRYEKSARLSAFWNRLPEATKTGLQTCERRLPQFMLEHVGAPWHLVAD